MSNRQIPVSLDPPDRSVSIPAWCAVFATVLVCTGYALPSGNHATQIPPILSLLDPELYVHDFHVQEMSRFTVRTYFIYMIYGLASTGLGMAGAFFTTYLIALAGYLWGAYLLGRAITGSRGAATAFMILAVLPLRMTVGVVFPFVPTPIPQSYAMPLAMFGIYRCMTRRWVSAYALFGVAGLFQFLVGTLPAAVLVLLMCTDVVRRRQMREGVVALSVFGLLIGSVYGPMAMTGTTSTSLFTGAEFVELYGAIRAPHHVILSSWPRHELAQFGSFVFGGLLCVGLSCALTRWIKAVVVTVIVGSVAALLAGYLLIEVWPVALLAKLQVARLTPYCQLLILAVLVAEVAYCWRQGWYPIAIAMLITPLIEYGGIVLAGLVVMNWIARMADDRLAKGWVSRAWRSAVMPGVLVVAVMVVYFKPPVRVDRVHIIAAFVLMGVVAGLPEVLSRYCSDRRVRIAVAWAVAAAGMGTAVVWTAGGRSYADREHLLFRPVLLWDDGVREIDALAVRMRRETSKDAVVLVPPSAQMFKLRSERSVVVDFKCFPLVDSGMIEWQQRMQNVLGARLEPGMVNAPELEKLYAKRSGADLKRVALKYGASYIVTRWHDRIDGCSEALREGAWVAFEIDRPA